MIKGIIKKIVGSRYAREVRRLGPLVDRINEQYATLEGISDEALRGKTDEFRDRIAARTRETQDEIESLRERKRGAADPDEREEIGLEISKLEERFRSELADALEEVLPEAFAVGEGGVPPSGRPGSEGDGAQAHLGHDSLRRAAHRCGAASPRAGCRDGHRRGQDARRDDAPLPERTRRTRCSSRHRKLLPRPARCGMDGGDLQPPRTHGRLHRPPRTRHTGAARGVQRRHHLRHQQRVRLRLPARQHGAHPWSRGCSACTATRSSTRSTPS